ncbi:MAG TPA: MBL fold metallo-hydrolase, partial [Steroidobacteraceae bacterium]|nr:MBL fold metallo-hydrolase [Steroidobacteraceae bacterium]
MSAARITFLGAVGTVTGSKYLLENDSTRLLIDCGLFQGYKNLRLRNWAQFPIDPKSINAVILTHAHLDHSGYLPLLIKSGFRGPVICTHSTRDLCKILLPDSGFLQEKDAEFANKRGFSKHHPALPLYTRKDADTALRAFRDVAFAKPYEVAVGTKLIFHPAGHILGAAIVDLEFQGTRIVFSGDLGRQNSATMLDPTPMARADYLIVESTYGDRTRNGDDPEDALAQVINRTCARGGTVLIPSFAVGRAQTLLYHLQRLTAANRIPCVPIYLDSPMAIDASELFCSHPQDHKLSAEQCRELSSIAHYVREIEESQRLNTDNTPKIIISASGMATGGRVLHHLRHLVTDARNTILFAGFQAGGTRGAALVGGAQQIKMHGQYLPVKAEIASLEMLSAHADSDEIMDWLNHFEAPPRMTFVTHGEPAAADALRRRIEEKLGWQCHVPEYAESASLHSGLIEMPRYPTS